MIQISDWMNGFVDAVRGTFGDRVWFVGLQGIYGRGEATDSSDIDVVVILDRLSAADVHTYGAMLDGLSHRDRICGFLAGKAELLNWEPSDLFQFYHDTKPVIGSLDALLPLLDQTAVRRAIKIGACNIHHGCVHNMLFEKSEDILKGLYKSAFFAVQAIWFLQTGRYVPHLDDLLGVVAPDEKAILDGYLNLKHGRTADFCAFSETLLAWCQKWIQNA